MISRTKDSAVDVRADDTAELGHCVGETDTNTGGHGALECSNTFGPDHRVGGTGAGCRDDEAEVLDGRVGDGDEDDVADYYG